VKPIQAIAGALLGLLVAGCAQAPQAAAVRRDPALERVMSLDGFDPALLSRAIFEESNRVRVAHGSPPLGHLAALDAAADEQATYLALTLSVGHTNPFPILSTMSLTRFSVPPLHRVTRSLAAVAMGRELPDLVITGAGSSRPTPSGSTPTARSGSSRAGSRREARRHLQAARDRG
jgi:hypothetical protein